MQSTQTLSRQWPRAATRPVNQAPRNPRFQERFSIGTVDFAPEWDLPAHVPVMAAQPHVPQHQASTSRGMSTAKHHSCMPHLGLFLSSCLSSRKAASGPLTSSLANWNENKPLPRLPRPAFGLGASTALPAPPPRALVRNTRLPVEDRGGIVSTHALNCDLSHRPGGEADEYYQNHPLQASQPIQLQNRIISRLERPLSRDWPLSMPNHLRFAQGDAPLSRLNYTSCLPDRSLSPQHTGYIHPIQPPYSHLPYPPSLSSGITLDSLPTILSPASDSNSNTPHSTFHSSPPPSTLTRSPSEHSDPEQNPALHALRTMLFQILDDAHSAPPPSSHQAPSLWVPTYTPSAHPSPSSTSNASSPSAWSSDYDDKEVGDPWA